ncbi:MAG: hypothetical protein ILO68_01700, partial [Clostridia bacterium]|nr:hypothetical protein [Clostridia bacterium]
CMVERQPIPLKGNRQRFFDGNRKPANSFVGGFTRLNNPQAIVETPILWGGGDIAKMNKVFEYACAVKYPCYSLYDFHGVLVKLENQYVYMYKDGSVVAVERIDLDGHPISCEDFVVEDCKIPDLWVRKDNRVYVSEKSAIDIKTGALVSNGNCSKEEFDDHEWRLSKEHYSIDQYVIRNVSPSIYECYDSLSGKKMWRVKLRGYLYREIELIDNAFVICTAEKGGGIFVIDALAGRIMYSVDTKGTSEMAHENGRFYSYVLGNKGVFFASSFKDGSIVDSAAIYRTTIDSPLLVRDGSALTVSFRERIGERGSGWIPVLTCFSL